MFFIGFTSAARVDEEGWHHAMGAIELGIPYLSAYAFSTENWRRHPDEVRFLMGFNRDVIHRRRDLLNDTGVRIRWTRIPPGWVTLLAIGRAKRS